MYMYLTLLNPVYLYSRIGVRSISMKQHSDKKPLEKYRKDS